MFWLIVLIRPTTCLSSYHLVGAFEAYKHRRTGEATIFSYKKLRVTLCTLLTTFIGHLPLSHFILCCSFDCTYSSCVAHKVYTAAKHIPILYSVCIYCNYCPVTFLKEGLYALFCCICALASLRASPQAFQLYSCLRHTVHVTNKKTVTST